MTHFFTLRQVFENFLTARVFSKTSSMPCACFLAKAALCAAKPSIMTQFSSLQQAF
jgi:hypothetical protein